MTTTPSPADFRRCADSLRADARCFEAMAACLEAQPGHLSFAATLVQDDRRHYLAMRDKRDLAASQADSIADTLAAELRGHVA